MDLQYTLTCALAAVSGGVATALTAVLRRRDLTVECAIGSCRIKVAVRRSKDTSDPRRAVERAKTGGTCASSCQGPRP